MDQAEEELIASYLKGDPKAIEMIYHRYKDKVFNFCYRLLGNRADAEDTTADVFTVLFQNKYKYDPKAKFSTWLFTVAHNSCMSQLRRRKGTKSIWFKGQDQKEQYLQVTDPKELSRETLMDQETKEIIKGAIEQLPLEQKEAIILREYQQSSYEEIASVLGCSLEKVKILIYRAREELRGRLASLIREDENAN